jgi:hypothetical protein
VSRSNEVTEFLQEVSFGVDVLESRASLIPGTSSYAAGTGLITKFQQASLFQALNEY